MRIVSGAQLLYGRRIICATLTFPILVGKLRCTEAPEVGCRNWQFTASCQVLLSERWGMWIIQGLAVAYLMRCSPPACGAVDEPNRSAAEDGVFRKLNRKGNPGSRIGYG